MSSFVRGARQAVAPRRAPASRSVCGVRANEAPTTAHASRSGHAPTVASPFATARTPQDLGSVSAQANGRSSSATSGPAALTCREGEGSTRQAYGLVEFGSDLTPSVIVGYEWERVDREAVRKIQCRYGNTIVDEAGGNLIDSLPYPDLDRSADVAAWLNRLREATTEPFYTRLTETDVTVLR